MMLWFRRVLGNFFAKLLLVLMIVSFAFFGYQSAFHNASSPNIIASVGDIDITTIKLQQAHEQLQQNYARAFGNQPLPDFFKSRLLDDAMTMLINDALIMSAAKKWDMPVPETRLLKTLSTYKAFQNEKGDFDPAIFKQVVEKAGLKTDEVLDDIRVSELQRYFRDGLLSATIVPQALIIATLQDEAETRSAKVLKITAEPATITVDDKTLQSWFEKNSSKYKTAEKRTFGYVQLGLTFTPQQINDYYGAHPDTFKTQEKRHILQLFCPDQNCVDKNKGLKTLSAEQKQVIDLGVVTKGDLLPALQQTAFKIPVQSISEPVKTDFGWTFLYVTDITPSVLPPLDSVRDKVIDALKTPAALEALYKQTTDLENAIAETGSLEKAATAMKLQYKRTTAVDKSNVPPILATLNDQIWNLPKNATSQLQETTPDNYVMVMVENILPTEMKTFAVARDEALQDYRKEQAKIAMEKQRDAIKKQWQALPEKDKLSFIGDDSVEAVESVDVNRAKSSEVWQADGAEVIFSANKGEIKDITNETESRLFMVTAIKRPDVKTFTSAQKEETQKKLKQEMADDLYQAFLQDLKKLFPVQINDSVLSKLKKNG